MTQKEKELILVDLYARLPYMPRVRIIYQQQGIKGVDEDEMSMDYNEQVINDLRNGVILDIKTYLRPMSSMTEEEKHYIDNRWGADNYGDIITYSFYESGMSTVELADIIEFQDWLNANHFDYRGLIPKGLALKAPEGIYK